MTKLAVSAVCRNEIDTVGAWIAHASQVFDYIYIADHGSTDGTEDVIRASAAVSSVSEYHSSIFEPEFVHSTLGRRIIEETDAEWIFYLDFDEFIPVEQWDHLRLKLRDVDGGVAKFSWRNAFKKTPGPLRVKGEYFVQQQLSSIGKVAARRDVVQDEAYTVPRGAHNLIHSTTGRVEGTLVGELLHFPIRSEEQAWAKILGGSTHRFRALEQDKNTAHHWHYVKMTSDALERGLSWNAVPFLVEHYGLPRRMSAEAPGMFDLRVLTLAHMVDEDVCCGPQEGATGLALATPRVRQRLSEFMQHSQGKQLIEKALSSGDGEIRRALDFGSVSFAPLPPESLGPLDDQTIVSSVQAAFAEIRHPVASSWGEHIPFLFSLMVLLRPRIFVELGVHEGASFLAACQSNKTHRIGATCLAIDTWRGDPQAGFYGDKVFTSFLSKLIQHYSEFAGYIQNTFNVASEQFGDGSIDLLHIDGFHSYDAVRSDFDTWLPKMSRRGVVMLHDISEHRADFGVWRLWDELSPRFPNIAFGHCHGLGVLFVGEDFRDDPSYLPNAHQAQLIKTLYQGVGKLAWSAARPAKLATPKVQSKQSPPPSPKLVRVIKRILAPFPPLLRLAQRVYWSRPRG